MRPVSSTSPCSRARAGRSAPSFTLTMAPTKLHTASARGAIVGGARVLTLPGRVLREMIESPLTARALERFVADARQCETQAPTAERRAREAS